MRQDFSKRLASIVGQKRVNQINKQADVAAQIIQARYQQQVSQQKLADAIGVAKSTIARIESGMTQPKTSTLYKISDVLNIPIIIDASQTHLDDPNESGNFIKI
ncbi:helix-turn-helix domain-containing protein [Oceanobacillus kapialis]|uniref:helix-turn-helix domain-containing protein n=1 Tax=Oceanobacillus kapialis TaxID=481353 RepID=UPI00384F1FAC